MGEKPNKNTLVEEPAAVYTARDYLLDQFDEAVEIIKGKLFKMAPAPTPNHQSVSHDLVLQIGLYFREKNCRVFEAPFDVYLVKPGEDFHDSKNVVQPDLCVICDETKIQKQGCIGAPDFIVEILSPRTAKKDQTVKRAIYEEHGVRELWIIHPIEKNLYIHLWEDGHFRTLPPYVEDQKVHSVIFPELEVDLKQVFRYVRED